MKKIILWIILIFAGITSFAQFENTLYFMNLPQATYLNPARQNSCSFYLGLPAISSEYTMFKNTGFRYIDVFDYNNYLMNATDTSFYADLEKLYNSLGERNYLIL